MEREGVVCEGDKLKNQVEAFEEMILEIHKPFTRCLNFLEVLILALIQAKPDTIFSRAKRKDIMLIEEVSDKPSLSSAPLKNLTKWNCELCQLVERPCDDMISRKKSEEGSSSPNNDDPPPLLIDDNADDMRKNVDHEKQNINGFRFWCDTCKIGTFAEKVMEAHKIGEKHKHKEENKLQRRSFTNETTIHLACGTSFR
ncbi:hypothetical protein H5410_051889 [Solanum commersonii]|uniref:Uncharacterized protein n=1 Tax=Solanum commersonii TaxID=4109 RepID=A0A9J5X211_SOLCO|nr:hypothetical protein H5410_051889 [Solanum commersonii]